MALAGSHEAPSPVSSSNAFPVIRPRGMVAVVEDAAAADHLAAVATALVPAHGRFLLIDTVELGTARRLLDGLALPWAELAVRHSISRTKRKRPQHTATGTSPLAAVESAPTHPHAIAAGDRDRGHGLDID